MQWHHLSKSPEDLMLFFEQFTNRFRGFYNVNREKFAHSVWTSRIPLIFSESLHSLLIRESVCFLPCLGVFSTTPCCQDIFSWITMSHHQYWTDLTRTDNQCRESNHCFFLCCSKTLLIRYREQLLLSSQLISGVVFLLKTNLQTVNWSWRWYSKHHVFDSCEGAANWKEKKYKKKRKRTHD